MLDTDKIYEQLVRAGEEWADLDAAATLLEETRKSVVAKIVNDGEGSIAGREYKALADPEYKRHVESMVAARKIANRARVRYDSARTLAELRRSEESTRRAEMGIR
jgi:hypothetical protein